MCVEIIPIPQNHISSCWKLPWAPAAGIAQGGKWDGQYPGTYWGSGLGALGVGSQALGTPQPGPGCPSILQQCSEWREGLGLAAAQP